MIINAITILRRSGGGATPVYKPITDFSGTPTGLAEGNTVDYTDLSTVDPLGPLITDWSWVFEGGTPSTSTSQNPTNILYNTPGLYDVTLTATNADGSTPLTKTDYITVNAYVPPTIHNSFKQMYWNVNTQPGPSMEAGLFNTNTNVL